MKTVDDVARSALGALGSVDMDGLVLAHGWVNERYQELVGATRYRHLRRAISVTIDAPETTGTIIATRGLRTIVGTATAFTPALVGRFLRLLNTWYEVTGVASATSLTISAPYADADLTDVGVLVVQRYVSLPPDIRYTTSWTLGRRWASLQEVSLRSLDDLIAPGRFYLSTLGANGGWIAHVGPRLEAQVFEVYPYSTTSETLHCVAYVAPPELRPDDSLPPTIDPRILKEGILVDTYRYAMGKAATAGRVDVMATWRNEMNSQMTRWDRVMAAASKADRALDDAEWLIQATGAVGMWMDDVRTAYDHVVVSGTRP